ncbi:MAG TPA: hypothetical protein VNE39_15890 [Planctomycetota bacterium]|nr:hypothetical protein [Planctomycetota bacterium]
MGLCVGLAAFAAAPETNPVPRPDALAAGGAAFAPLPPFVAAPQPAGRSLVPLLVRPWLPPAGGLGTPRLLAVDRQGRLRLRPVADRPEIAATPGIVRFLRTGSGAYVVAPDATDLVRLRLGPDAAPGLPPRVAALPAARPVQGHRWLPTNLQWAMRLRPLPDSSAVEEAPDPFAVRPPRMLLRPPAVASSPEVTQAPLLSVAFLPKPDRPAPTSDPTWDHSYRAAIARKPELARPAAPFLRLTIPDPFETASLVQLRHPLPDADPPSAAPGLPDRPTFPVKP